jgi:hypothetical protein
VGEFKVKEALVQGVCIYIYAFNSYLFWSNCE